jgi:hypothetical protein
MSQQVPKDEKYAEIGAHDQRQVGQWEDPAAASPQWTLIKESTAGGNLNGKRILPTRNLRREGGGVVLQ